MSNRYILAVYGAMLAICVPGIIAPDTSFARDKDNSRLEEHYETVPPDFDPGTGADNGQADGSGASLPEPVPPPRARARDGASSGDSRADGPRERDRGERGMVSKRSDDDLERIPRSERRRGREALEEDGGDVADVSYFYETLESGGTWVNHPRWGEVWRPDVEETWRPYTDGRWAYSDSFGWTWISYEPFGWAVYHYGRWTYDRDGGWFWIPGTDWAPAWVAWRRGEEAIGWAPLPPNAHFENGRPGFDPVELETERYERAWVFVRPRYFARPDMNRYLRPESWNAELRYRTAPLHPMERFADEERRSLLKRGMAIEEVERLSSRPVPRMRVEPVDEPALRRRGSEGARADREGREVKFFRPDRKSTEDVVRKHARDKDGSQAKHQKVSGSDAPQRSDEHEDRRTREGKAPSGSRDGVTSKREEDSFSSKGGDSTGQASRRRDAPAASTTGSISTNRPSELQSGPAGHSERSSTPHTEQESSQPAPANLPASKKRWDGSGPSGAPTNDGGNNAAAP